jgi:drug/metabolite transporter (DMT)-like permease
MCPFSDPTQAASVVSIASAFFHDSLCAVWLIVYVGMRKRMGATMKALKTRSGLIVMVGAFLGGPIGMTGYLMAINNIGPGYTAIVSACYPALGALLSYVFLKERMHKGQVGALVVALAGVMAIGFISSGDSKLANPTIGFIGALLAVAGWGSEGVLCAWGMRDDAVDNDTALQIRETTSALAYALIALPLFGAWKFTARSITTPRISMIVILLAALAGTTSYLCYYKGIEVIGAARAMALNISYSAWAVVFGFVLQGTKPSMTTMVLCVLILCNTVLAASDWNELFHKGRNKTE